MDQTKYLRDTAADVYEESKHWEGLRETYCLHRSKGELEGGCFVAISDQKKNNLVLLYYWDEPQH